MEKIMSITRVMAISVVWLFLLGYSTGVNAQTATAKPYPVIGQPCPPFLFDDVVNYKSSQLSSKDLNGHYYILDFWAQTCVGCIASFPHSNDIQRKYGDKIKIVLVGYSDNKKKIKSLFENISKRENLELTCALDTTTIKKFLPGIYNSLPTLVWINSQGIVVAVTDGDDLRENNINDFVDGKTFKFYDKSIESQMRDHEVSQNIAQNRSNVADNTWLYTTSIKNWEPGMGSAETRYNLTKKNVRIKYYSSTKQTIKGLLKDFYLDKDYWNDTISYRDPIFELRDSSKFYSNEGQIQYCFQIQFPGDESFESAKMKAGKILQIYFDFKASIQERQEPCYFIRVKDIKKLKQFVSSGIKDDSLNHWDHGEGGELYNQSMYNLARILGIDLPIKVIDDTGVKFKIDIPLFVITTFPADVKRGLNQYGLELVLGQKNFKTLVIRN
ncbi:Thioredoxin-like [bacterium A37T11]|nr:Thioredoxin-like [bacterium A37T11]